MDKQGEFTFMKMVADSLSKIEFMPTTLPVSGLLRDLIQQLGEMTSSTDTKGEFTFLEKEKVSLSTTIFMETLWQASKFEHQVIPSFDITKFTMVNMEGFTFMKKVADL